MPGPGHLLMLPTHRSSLTQGITLVSQACLRQGNVLPVSEAAQSFACSFIAKAHEMNYAKLENVTESPLRDHTCSTHCKTRKCCPQCRCFPRQFLSDTCEHLLYVYVDT